MKRCDPFSDWLREAICRAFCPHKPKKPKLRAHVRIGSDGASVSYTTIKGAPFIMKQVPDTDPKRVPFSVKFTDAAGNPGKVDVSAGPPNVTSDRPDIWAVENVAATADGVTGEAVAQGPTGAANLSLDVDVDLGDGVESLLLTGVIERTATKVTGGTFEFGPAHD